MDKTQIVTTVDSAKELFEMVMDLYSKYLEELEVYVKAIPETEIEILNELNRHMAEVQEAIEHDMGIFEEAINYDKENLHQLKDKLKINSIYKILGQK